MRGLRPGHQAGITPGPGQGADRKPPSRRAQPRTDRTDDGGATGRIAWDRAAFMQTRSGADYPPQLDELFQKVRDQEGEDVAVSPFPVLDFMHAWEVWSALTLHAPDIEHRTGCRRRWRPDVVQAARAAPCAGGHVDPDAARRMLEWDGHQWVSSRDDRFQGVSGRRSDIG